MPSAPGRTLAPVTVDLLSSGGDPVALVLRAAITIMVKAAGKSALSHGCTPENLDNILRWIDSPKGRQRTWDTLLGLNPGLRLLTWGPLGSRLRGQYEALVNYLLGPAGRPVAQEALTRLCEEGSAYLGVQSATVAPGVATALAQTVERCGCFSTPRAQPTLRAIGIEETLQSREYCCDAARAAHDLRAFDLDLLARRHEAQTGWSDLPADPVIERAVAQRRQLTVNIAAMWRMATSNLYKTDDLISLATREALQNAVDSLRRAVRQGKIQKDSAYFSVSWQDLGDGTGILEFEDNGVGMGESILITKFLELGSSGKEGEEGSAGGFGMAKAVILGVSPTFHWELHTQDRIARSLKGSMDYDLVEAPYRQGFRLTLYDVPSARVWSDLYNEYLTVPNRIRRMLAWSHVPDVRLRFEGEEIESAYPARRGSRLRYDIDWGSTNVEVKGYKRTDTAGSILVRVKGLFQFSESGVTGLQSDVVLEMEPTVRPGSPGYPFPPSRDTLRGQANNALYKLRQILTQEARSGADDREYDDLLPDSQDPKERAGAEAFNSALSDAMDDPEIQRMLAELSHLADEVAADAALASLGETRPEAPSPDAAPASPHVMDDPYANWREATVALAQIGEEGGVATASGRGSLGNLIRTLILTGPADLQDTLSTVGGSNYVYDVISDLENGVPLGAEDGKSLLTVIQAAQPKGGLIPGQTGTLATAAVARDIGNLIADSMENRGAGSDEVAKVRKKASEINPFGTAMVKISRVNFDKDRAKKFLKQAKKYIGYLVAWEAILRLVHKEGRLRIPFKPGFILDDGVNAMAFATGETGQGRQVYVLLNPFKLQTYLETHKDRPFAVANWLFTVGCHELAHIPHMGKHHGEEFVVEREGLQMQTGHLTPAIERLVIRALKMKVPKAYAKASGSRVLLGQLRRAEETARAAEAAKAAAERELRQISQGNGAGSRARSEAWDVYGIVKQLQDLHRAETFAAWAASDQGRAILGDNGPKIAIILRNDPSRIMEILGRINPA